ncbi:phosphatidate cytidylyltransferase [Candidatus Pelagibacter sp.]|nr:phosphatidate cytidylyltransferase [Candidatus Pelagibacter sp.]
MTQELKKRIITSFFLITLLFLMFTYIYILITALIVIAIIAWVEFYHLISKIFPNKNFRETLLRFAFKSTSLVFLTLLAISIIVIEAFNSKLSFFVYLSLLVSIASDLGGLVIGKTFKGKKLTKISPNKTISGSVGSFVFSLLLIPIHQVFMILPETNYLILIVIVISFTSQLGDLLISFLKRKAKVKDTSNLLPGHGGVLDRIDGIIFAVPVGLMLFNFIL